MKKLADILSVIRPKNVIGPREILINSICYNSSKCYEKSLFVAIKGNQVDGHSFIDSAIDKGASSIVCEKLPERINNSVCYLVVENSRRALALLAHYWYDYPASQMKIFGITGTNGKTTITYILRAIFQNAGFSAGIIGTTGAFANEFQKLLNNTTPESLDLAQIFYEFQKRSVEYVAMEVSSHSLDQERVFGINFDCAIFTNLTQDHLDYHSSFEEYAKAKKKLFDELDSNSLAVVNSDDKLAKYILTDTKSKKKILVGQNSNSDVQIFDEEIGISGSKFRLKLNSPFFPQQIFEVRTSLVGRFNIENVALAIVSAIAKGIPFQTIQKALDQFQGVPGRMQKIELKNGALGIVDYAHTPDALAKVLNACRQVLSEFKQKNNKLICIFGCGGNRDKEKRPIMGKIASSLADFVVITSDNPRTENPDKIIRQIYQGIDKEERKKVILISNRDEAIKYAVDLSKAGDIILVAGKGHEDYQVIGEVRYHFSDIEQLGKYGQQLYEKKE